MIRPVITLITALMLAPAAQSIQITVTARSLQPGEVAVLSIVTALPAETIHVRAFDRDIHAYQADGVWRAIVGIDMDVKPGTYAVTVESGTGANLARVTHDLKIEPRVFRTRRLTVNEA